MGIFDWIISLVSNVDWITAIVSLALFIGASFFTGYLRGKGANLATKQDVGRITKEVENAKKEYAEEIEKLKSYLQVVIGNHTLIQEKRNDAIINFYEDCMTLFNENLHVELLPDDTKSLREFLIEYQTSTENIFTKIYSDYYRLFLYLDPKDQVLLASGAIIQSIPQIKEVFRNDFPNVESALLKRSEAFINSPDIEIYNQQSDETYKVLKEYMDKMNSAKEFFYTMFAFYINKLNNYFKELGYEESVKDISL